MNRRPDTRTIRRVVEWLESIGLEVHGPHMTDDGEEHPGYMDYDLDDILMRYTHIRKGKLKRDEVLSALAISET